jgi:CheY-like chemotaxis protein
MQSSIVARERQRPVAIATAYSPNRLHRLLFFPIHSNSFARPEIRKVSPLRNNQSVRYSVGMVSRHILAVVQSDLQLICSLRRVLDENGFPSLTVARNSEEAILYLRGIGIYQNRSRYPLPALVVLDSQNPDAVDLEVLAWLRERSAFCEVPVIFLCTESHSFVHIACALDPASFIVERGNCDDLLDALRNLLGPQTFISPESLIASRKAVRG